MDDGNINDGNNDAAQQEEEPIAFEHYEAYLTAESIAHFRRLLGKRVKKVHSRIAVDRNGESITSAPLDIEVDGGHLILDIDPRNTGMHYFFFPHLSAISIPPPEITGSASTEERIAGTDKTYEAIADPTNSPILQIEVYEGQLEDSLQEHYESAAFDQVIVFRHEDGKWFAVSAKPGDENLAIEVLEDEDRLLNIFQGKDREYVPCRLRLTIE